MAKCVKSDGAGYMFDKKAWNEAAKDGLKKRILERLAIFDRPVDAETLADRLSVTSNIPYTTGEVRQMLSKLTDAKLVVKDGEMYSLNK